MCAGTCRSQKRANDTLHLELQMVLSYSIHGFWELGSSPLEEQEMLLAPEPSFHCPLPHSEINVSHDRIYTNKFRSL